MENYQYLDDLGLNSKNFLNDLASTIQEGQGKRYQSYQRPSGINEKLVQCLWVDQMFRKDRLTTVEGQKLEILSPGWWNLEGGPDFQLGKLRFSALRDKDVADRITVGDIEVHLLASSWKTHGHNKDKHYDRVILHVFLWQDNYGEPALNSAGRQVSQLELLPFLTRSLEELKENVRLYEYPFKNPGSRGKCYEILKLLKSRRLGKILDDLGDGRFLAKAAKFGDLLSIIEGEGPPLVKNRNREQLIYGHLMESMGIKNNRLQFCQLATLIEAENVAKILKAVPSWKKVRTLEAVLMVATGFLPLWETRENLDRQSRHYLTQLRKDSLTHGLMESEFLSSSRKAEDVLSSDCSKTLDGKDWQYRGMRPANYPPRRIAGLSHFLVNCGQKGIFASGLRIFQRADDLFSSIIPATEHLFRLRYTSYWNLRYSFNGKQLPRPVALIGQEKIAVTLVNVFLPLYFAWAWLNGDLKLGKNLYQLWRNFPAQGLNNVINFMETRLLGHDKRRRKIINSARRQQALIQIYQRYCQSAETSCEDCEFLKGLGEGNKRERERNK